MKVMTEPWDGFLPRAEAADAYIDTSALAGKRVLVTGAGGYIGSALARSLERLDLAHLVLLDIAEHGLYRLEQAFQQTSRSLPISYLIGSVCDEALVRELFAVQRIDVVFHAAALKHVPLMESNPLAAIETNVLGMHTVARAATEHNAERLILLSTDKAVDPISVMGASKRLAELIALASDAPGMVTAVRLCNVLGSSGSVAPQFVQQIRSGLAVTVTHPEATRYFLSLNQTVRLLLQAATFGNPAKLLVPRVGAQANIADLARFLIGTNKNKIVYTQLRPGDKLHESMTSSRESLRDNTGSLIPVESPCLDAQRLHDVLARVGECLRKRDVPALLATIRDVVPEYTPAAEACIR